MIGGFQLDANRIGALLIVGYYEANPLRFAARVGAGFVSQTRTMLQLKLKPLDRLGVHP